jgi:hypothetical protein
VSTDTLALDPQADWYASAEETKDGLIDLYRRVWVFAGLRALAGTFE